ncbi:MAG: phosphate uptake regulator PhoU [Sulfolobales archaeon]|nr:phosphate uptake regulator PhoU [Sulfolobales archaeon]
MEVKQEIRTLQKLGGSIALYLPKEWCRRNGIDRGSKVVVRYGEKALCVEIGEVRERSAVVDLDGIFEGELKYVLISLYVMGFDRVRLVSKKRIGLSVRRFILQVLNYTPGYEIAEEGENFVTIAIAREPGSPFEAVLREFNSVSTVFKYVIEVLEKAASISEEYADAVGELDSEVDRAWFEVERAIYKAIDRPHPGFPGVRVLISLLLVSRYLERLSDHLVQLVYEVREQPLQQLDVANQVRAMSSTFLDIAEIFKNLLKSREDSGDLDTVSKLVNLIENKKSLRYSVIPRLRKESGTLAAYHVMRIYDYITDIAEVAINVIVSGFYSRTAS